DKPLWVKLSPNAGDIVSIAQATEDAGADALVIANTFLSLKIRTDNFRPALGNKFGGLISPALKPIVLRMVYQVARVVKIPIIGIGGETKPLEAGLRRATLPPMEPLRNRWAS